MQLRGSCVPRPANILCSRKQMPMWGGVMTVQNKLGLPADEARVPIEDPAPHWRNPVKETTVGANICKASFRRSRPASRRIERQRIREVPTLSLGFYDSASNWYSKPLTRFAGKKRSSASNISVDPKRCRQSPRTSRSHSDDDAASIGSGFVVVGGPEDDRFADYKFTKDIYVI